MRIGRRGVLLGGLGLLGAGALGYGGSLAACAMRGDRQAMLRPLYIALTDSPAPADRIGQAWLKNEDPETATRALVSDTGVISALLVVDAAARRARLSEVVTSDFRENRVVLADRWVVSRTEARLAAAWISDTA